MITCYVKDLSIKQINWFIASIADCDMCVDSLPVAYRNGFYYSLGGSPVPIQNYVQGCTELFQETLDEMRINISYTSQKCYASLSILEGGDIIQEGATAREAVYRCMIQLHRGEKVVLPKCLEETLAVTQAECAVMEFERTIRASPSKPEKFTSLDAPDWITSKNTVVGSTMDYRWFWEKHVLTLQVGQSVDTDFSTITRIK